MKFIFFCLPLRFGVFKEPREGKRGPHENKPTSSEGKGFDWMKFQDCSKTCFQPSSRPFSQLNFDPNSYMEEQVGVWGSETSDCIAQCYSDNSAEGKGLDFMKFQDCSSICLQEKAEKDSDCWDRCRQNGGDHFKCTNDCNLYTEEQVGVSKSDCIDQCFSDNSAEGKGFDWMKFQDCSKPCFQPSSRPFSQLNFDPNSYMEEEVGSKPGMLRKIQVMLCRDSSQNGPSEGEICNTDWKHLVWWK